MRYFSSFSLLLFGALSLAGCGAAPGKPLPGSEAQRPDQVLDFPILYQENCSACHGDQGRAGAAISLANPTYLTFAGSGNLARITAKGVPGTMMPPFGQKSGGMLTDQQIQVLTQGMLTRWSKPGEPLAVPYVKTLNGDATQGQVAFVAKCSRCHGADATGSSTASPPTGSLVDPSYLALISEQGLRSILVAGQPDEGMPGAAQLSDNLHPMTDQDVTNIVAWLTAHRSLTPGHPHPQHP